MTTAQFAILAVALFIAAMAAFARSTQYDRLAKTYLGQHLTIESAKTRLHSEGLEIVGLLLFCGFFFAAGIAAVRWIA